MREEGKDPSPPRVPDRRREPVAGSPIRPGRKEGRKEGAVEGRSGGEAEQRRGEASRLLCR